MYKISFVLIFLIVVKGFSQNQLANHLENNLANHLENNLSNNLANRQPSTAVQTVSETSIENYQPQENGQPQGNSQPQENSQLQENGQIEISVNQKSYWQPESLNFLMLPDFKEKLLQKNENSNQKNLSALEKEQCQKAYSKFSHKKNIKWSIFFGYGDISDPQHTSDLAERDLFERELISECDYQRPSNKVCGFEKLSENLYKKTIYSSSSEPVTYEIKLYNASADSVVEKQKENKIQKKHSKTIQNLFSESLKKDDFVFYVGHARYGTGPGFKPLEKFSFSWFIAALFRPSSQKLRYSLGYEDTSTDMNEQSRWVINEKQPDVIGFFACDAEGHYGKMLSQLAPNSGLILTRQSILTSDNLKLLYAATQGLLNKSCESDMQSDFNSAISTVFYNPQKGPPTNEQITELMPKFFNFYHKDKIKNKSSFKMLFVDPEPEELILSNEK